MIVPAQKRNRSVQEVGTPPEFLDAVIRRFGMICVDAAANADNHVPQCGWYGPGSAWREDALTDAPWAETPGLHWLNPPYDNVRAFAKKAREETARGCRIVMLVPASVSTNWFAEEIYGHALVLPIRPRLTFVGHSEPFPRDLMLCCYNLGPPGFSPWKWK
jgi:phage N-6-adenine-methyltransferase